MPDWLMVRSKRRGRRGGVPLSLGSQDIDPSLAGVPLRIFVVEDPEYQTPSGGPITTIISSDGQSYNIYPLNKKERKTLLDEEASNRGLIQAVFKRYNVDQPFQMYVNGAPVDARTVAIPRPRSKSSNSSSTRNKGGPNGNKGGPNGNKGGPNGNKGGSVKEVCSDLTATGINLSDDLVEEGGKVIDIQKIPTGSRGSLGAIRALGQFQLIRGGIDKAPQGAIQDPAGTGIGATIPTGDGASGAIYGTFSGHLAGIPPIKPTCSIFNPTEDTGKRVLHTYSPHFKSIGIDPKNEGDRNRALLLLTKSYISALEAFKQYRGRLDSRDRDTLNLIPVSAAIYAGKFAFNGPGYPPRGHLDPSYTLLALSLAFQHSPPLEGVTYNMYYFDETVLNSAQDDLDHF